MERNGERCISVNSTRDDFLRLNLSIHSSADDWNQALKILDDRICGRFFVPIGLLQGDSNQNGFAIMALDCLLVETFYQFYNGVDQTSSGYNGTSYAAFLDIIMPGAFPNDSSRKKFFSNIRCGILHSAQTKGDCQLTFDKPYIIEVFDNGNIRVNVEKFTERLQEYYNSYRNSLRNENNVILRQAFINKMVKICKIT